MTRPLHAKEESGYTKENPDTQRKNPEKQKTKQQNTDDGLTEWRWKKQQIPQDPVTDPQDDCRKTNDERKNTNEMGAAGDRSHDRFPKPGNCLGERRMHRERVRRHGQKTRHILHQR